MNFTEAYLSWLRRTQALLTDFGTYFRPISMASSAETGAFLAAMVERLNPPAVLETGSGFSSAVLGGAIHVEDNAEYQERVIEWLGHRGIPVGGFMAYEAFYLLPVDSVFLLFLDGNLTTREGTCTWLQDKLARAVVVIDDAQQGTFTQVQAVLDILRMSPQGRLIDCASWTRDQYGRSAALWIGEATHFPAETLDEILQGPLSRQTRIGGQLIEPTVGHGIHLLLCVNDTPENGRWECTVRTLTSIGITANLREYPLWVIDNGSTCPNTLRFLSVWVQDQLERGAQVRLFRLPHNCYATYAFNRLLAMVPDHEFFIRIENDIEFLTINWPEVLVQFLIRSGFGLVSAKPVNLPSKAQDIAMSEIVGWRAQQVGEVPGFCTAFAPELRLQLGALASAGCYIEDLLTSERTQTLGYRMAFLDPAELCCFHVDRGAKQSYQDWKVQAARSERDTFLRLREEWRSGTRSPYVGFEFRTEDGFVEVT